MPDESMMLFRYSDDDEYELTAVRMADVSLINIRRGRDDVPTARTMLPTAELRMRNGRSATVIGEDDVKRVRDYVAGCAIEPVPEDSADDDHPWTMRQLTREIENRAASGAGRTILERQAVALNYLLYYLNDADVRRAVEDLTRQA